MPFQPNDLVLCVEGAPPYLVVGNVYAIKEVLLPGARLHVDGKRFIMESMALVLWGVKTPMAIKEGQCYYGWRETRFRHFTVSPMKNVTPIETKV